VGITFIFVTHDQEEAMAMSDRVAVMRDGAIVQVGSPSEIYLSPRTEFVSTFVGHAISLPGEIVAGPDGVARLRCGDQSFEIPAGDASAAPGARVRLILRPERLRLAAAAFPDLPNMIRGRVETRSFLGAEARTFVTTAFGQIVVSEPSSVAGGNGFAEGTEVWIGWSPADATLVAA
ncbi:MAG: TOBE domain-containing protein, partial [Rhodobacteraceae bacterium]